MKALFAVAVALALAGCNTSYNYFQEESDASEDVDVNAFGAMLRMSGMVAEPKAPIDYSPRAPLAMPASEELPPPQDTSAAEAAVGFPVDQDEEDARRRDELRGSLAGPDYRNDAVRENSQARLEPETIQAGRREGGGLRRWADNPLLNPFGRRGNNISREEMRVTAKSIPSGGTVLEEDGTAAPRRYLIQPPTTYRTPADTAPLPEKKEIKNSDWVNDRLYNLEDRRPRRLQE